MVQTLCMDKLLDHVDEPPRAKLCKQLHTTVGPYPVRVLQVDADDEGHAGTGMCDCVNAAPLAGFCKVLIMMGMQGG